MSTDFSTDPYSAYEAKSIAQQIAFSPFVFQATLAARNLGLLEVLEKSENEGLCAAEISRRTGVSVYGVKVLLGMALSSRIVRLIEDRYALTKIGFYVLHDAMTRVNFNFVNDVCYEALAELETSVVSGKPEGLKALGDWPTIYPGLSELPEPARTSWFEFDHYYSAQAFPEAYALVMQCRPKVLMDLGGNTGKWARLCVEKNREISVLVVDLPEQIALLGKHMEGHPDSQRVTGVGLDMLAPGACLPTFSDVIWMSQFLDCFSEDQIGEILNKCSNALSTQGRLFILETFWDKQEHETGALSVNAISLYFTAIANGYSRMYHSSDFKVLLGAAGFEIVRETNSLGVGHTLFECVKRVG
ncbi:MAG: methyltransferase domain-containing protein [Gammaproteobacteria bacterium]|nr:methyltransferase domain-containing protein [Gammaproteobacteria bacterium]